MLLDGIFEIIPLLPRNSRSWVESLVCRLKTLRFPSVLLGVRLGGGDRGSV